MGLNVAVVMLEPLAELNVIKWLALHESLGGDDFLNVQILHCLLDNVVVDCVLILALACKLDLLQGNTFSVDGVEDLCICSTITNIFINIGNVGIEHRVHPFQKLTFAHLVGGMVDADVDDFVRHNRT